MNKYELTLVLSGDATAAKKKAVTEKVKKIVAATKGKVGKVEDWGKQDLAYKIKENEAGVFLHFPLELEANAAKGFNAKLRLEEEIIRYLLVKG